MNSIVLGKPVFIVKILLISTLLNCYGILHAHSDSPIKSPLGNAGFYNGKPSGNKSINSIISLFQRSDSLKFNNPRIKDVSDKLLLSIGTLVKSYEIRIENVPTGKSLNIDPSGSMNIGLGFNYKWIGLNVSFGMPTGSKDEQIYGESQKQDFQLKLYSNAFAVQSHYQRYNGFHVSEQNGVTLEPENDKIVFPSLETYSIGVSTWYFFNNKKFSYKAAYVRNAIQLKSAGSAIAGAYYSYDNALTEESIGQVLPDSLKVDFDFLGYSSRTLGVAFGYSYTLVLKKFFLNGTIVPGIGLKNVSLWSEKESISVKDGITGRITTNLALGYEAKHFILGIRAFTSSRVFEANGIRISPKTNSISFFVGKRFIMPKFKNKKRG